MSKQPRNKRPEAPLMGLQTHLSGAGRRHEVSEASARAAADRAEGRSRKPAQKKSVTLDAEVSESVAEHVQRGAAANFSAAINEAAARWAANQDLAVALEEMYAEDPASRPTEEAVARAAAKLGL